jgi:hypothetical protein
VDGKATDIAKTAAPAPTTTSVPTEPIARWGFHLRMTFQNNCRFVSELCPSHTTFSLFPNALSSDGRTVAHARVTNFPSVSDVDLIVSLLYHCVC